MFLKNAPVMEADFQNWQTLKKKYNKIMHERNTYEL